MPELVWKGKDTLTWPTKESCELPGYVSKGSQLIWGDNLPVMRALYNNSKRFDLAYLDPPYNTGNTGWIYGDSVGVDAWLSWIWLRMHAVHDLLRDHGVMMLSIGGEQYENIVLICDEIFGRENKLETIIWKTKSASNNAQTISGVHEYILVYTKSLSALKGSGRLPWRLDRGQAIKALEYSRQILGEVERESLIKTWYKAQIHREQEELISQGIAASDAAKRARAMWKGMTNYQYFDDRGLYYATDMSAPGAQGKRYDVRDKKGLMYPSPSRGWAVSELKMKEFISEDLIHFAHGSDGSAKQPLKKLYLHDATETVMTSVLDLPQRKATLHLEKALGKKTAFPYPKPVELMEMLYSLASKPGESVLEPFAGSASGVIAAANTGREITAIEYSERVQAEIILPRLRSLGISLPVIASAHPGDEGAPARQ